MQTNHFYIFVIPILMMTACSSSGPQKPDWVDGQAAKYPSQMYLTGRGQNESRAIAQDRARADLSKIFQVKLSEQSEDNTEYKSVTVMSKQVSKLQSSSNRNIKTRLEQVVSGIQIAESWLAPEQKQYHILAVLDRTKMTNSLRQTINQQDSATDKEVSHSQQQNELLMKINHANRALSLQVSRQANQRLLTIIDPIGVGVKPRYNPESLLTDRNALLRRIHIAVEITHDSIGDIDSIVTGALASSGFQHEKNPDKANYLLLTKLNVEQTTDKSGWYWYRGSLQINLTNQKTKQDGGSHRWEIKVSAQNPGLAIQRVRDAVNKKLSAELQQAIIKLALSK